MNVEDRVIREALESSLQFVAKWSHDHSTGNEPNKIGIRQCARIRAAIALINMRYPKEQQHEQLSS